MLARQQENAFARKITDSPDFTDWLLKQTKFSGIDARPVLVRSDNPWYQSKKTGVQSETDILAIFEACDGSRRFALHFENKRMTDKFRPRQPELYHERAADWMNSPKWGNYTDFEVILIAPEAFISRNKERSGVFHRRITHETLAQFLPEFAESPTGRAATSP